MPIAISILGVTGKMGKSVLKAAAQDPEIFIVAASAHPQSTSLGIDLGNLIGSKMLNIFVLGQAKQALSQCDVAIEFSVREAILPHVYAAQETKKALVIGTTGLLPEEMRHIEKAAQDIPIILSANYSLGISLCIAMTASLARTLFGRCHIDIFETHHIHKKDRPSGTALAFAHAIGSEKIVYDSASLTREKEEIAIHSNRIGETVGEHRVVFTCEHESIEIKHVAHSRQAFAQGALLAAKLLADKPAGLYSLNDLFAHAFR